MSDFLFVPLVCYCARMVYQSLPPLIVIAGCFTLSGFLQKKVILMDDGKVRVLAVLPASSLPEFATPQLKRHGFCAWDLDMWRRDQKIKLGVRNYVSPCSLRCLPC